VCHARALAYSSSDETISKCNHLPVTAPQYRGQRWRALRLTVLERDRWICQLCHEPIDPYARAQSSGAGVVDHITPVSAGGAWHDLANLRAAHVRCNTARANTGRGAHLPYPLPRRW
jgi:5-methylcytosine-specific restriction endonuclease McrA